MTYASQKVWSDKARAAALAKRRGQAAPTTPQQSGTAEQAVAHANALIASGILNKGKKGKGKAGGKGKAPAKAPKVKDPAAVAEHAQRQAEHVADRAQRQQDRTARIATQAQSHAEHEQDRTARQQSQAAAVTSRAKAQADKAKQAKEKAKASDKAKVERQQAQTAKDTAAQAKKPAGAALPPGVADAAATLASGTNITPAQQNQLIATGLATTDKTGRPVLTPAGRRALTQKSVGSLEQQRAMFASMGSAGTLQKRGPSGKRTPQATAAHGGGGRSGGSQTVSLDAAPKNDPTVHTTVVHDDRPQGQRPALRAPVSGDLEAHAAFRQQKLEAQRARAQSGASSAHGKLQRLNALQQEIQSGVSRTRLREISAEVAKLRGKKSMELPMDMRTLRALEADVRALKIGARNSRPDQQHLDQASEHIHALGGRCPDCAPPDDASADLPLNADPLMAKAAPPMDAVAAPPAPDDTEEAGEGEDDEDEEAGNTGLMIALQVPPDVASELALDGEVAPEDLHLTLCFLGDAADFQKQQFQILGAVEQVIADAQPLQATIGGVGRFATPEEDGTNAFYASVDCPELADFRQSIVDALSAMDITVDESHGFTPHITLAYIAAGADTPASMPAVTDIAFDTVVVAFGDHQVLFPLGDPTADQAALDAEQDDGTDAPADGTDTTTAPMAKSVGDATMVNYGGAVKSMDSGHVGGYLVRFSGPNDPDLTGDFFTPDTDFGFNAGETLKTAVYFNHRLPMKTRDGREMVIKQKIGTGTLSMDDIGVFIDAVLYNREQYEATLGSMGWSSGTASHLVDREFVGKSMWVKSWQLGLDASVTPTPAEPRNGAVSLKAFLLDTQPEASASKTARSAVARSADVDSDDPPLIIIRRKQPYAS